MKYTAIKFFCALSLAASAYAAPVGIASGPVSGTNYPMTQDIVNICSTPQSPITNVISDGSMDNIAKVYSDKSSQYGIAQADALVYQRGVDPKMMERIKGVFPFFSSEIHLVVKDNSPINSVNDLQGKRVVESIEGSGTWVSVQVIKGLTGIKWSTMNADHAQSLAAVQNGQADAFFINAGRPVGLLSKLPSGVKLVPLSHQALDQFPLYTKSMIPSNSYPFQKNTVQTYKMDNILITYAFDSQYQKEIGDLVTCMTKNIGRFQQEGHPKWREVDINNINNIKWPMHKAALAAANAILKKK